MLRRRGALDMVTRMPPADQQAFWQYAERMGPAAAVQKLVEFLNVQEQVGQPLATTPAPGATGG